MLRQRHGFSSFASFHLFPRLVQVNRIRIPGAPCKITCINASVKPFNAWKSIGSVCSTVTRTLPRRSLSSPPHRWELQQGHPVRVPPLLSNLCSYVIFDAKTLKIVAGVELQTYQDVKIFWEKHDFPRFLSLTNLAMLKDKRIDA